MGVCRQSLRTLFTYVTALEETLADLTNPAGTLSGTGWSGSFTLPFPSRGSRVEAFCIWEGSFRIGLFAGIW